MRKIVIISGSPFAPSRTDLVLQHIESLLNIKEVSFSAISSTKDLYRRFEGTL